MNVGLKPPDLSHLRVFGSKGHALIPENKRKKFEDKTTDCLMMGYCSSQKGYKLWSIKHKKFFSSKDVKFEDSKPLENNSQIHVDLSNKIDSNNNENLPKESNTQPQNDITASNLQQNQIQVTAEIHHEDNDMVIEHPVIPVRPTRVRELPRIYDQSWANMTDMDFFHIHIPYFFIYWNKIRGRFC